MEEYRLEAFETIVDKILEMEPAKLSDEVSSQARASSFEV